jgi:hypothetical protein
MEKIPADAGWRCASVREDDCRAGLAGLKPGAYMVRDNDAGLGFDEAFFEKFFVA